MGTSCLLICCSYHHKNTRKIADTIARVLDAEVRTPRQLDPGDLEAYRLVGFGSGIDGGKHYRALLDFVDGLPFVADRKAFVFSTCGVPAIGFSERAVRENHSALRGKLQARGYIVVDEFGSLGFNTNSFLKLFGGINKGRPNAEDLKRAEEFAQKLKQSAAD